MFRRVCALDFSLYGDLSVNHPSTRSLRSLPQRNALSSLFVAAIGSALPTASALAQAPTQLPGITVQSSGVKTEQSASVKLPVPLLDTPQTVTVIPKVVMEEQNVHSLKRVLANVPGITFDAGEGGGGAGDKLFVRGFSGNANMMVDGLRDSAQIPRTDLFNMEQVEVTKGPNSVAGGAGTTGGSINMVSKQPRAESFTELGGGLGTDKYRRLTLDTNQVFGADGDVAARINLMTHRSDVAERDHIYRKRWGVAPSVTFGLGRPTSVTLSYVHQYDDNLPDYGLPARDGVPLPGIARNKYFGWRNLDKERIDTDVATMKLEHAFTDAVKLQNLTRWSHIKRDAVISASHVSTTGLGSTTDASGAPVPAIPAPPAGRYHPAGPQAYGRDTATQMWTNQTNLAAEFETGIVKHNLAAGLEITRETYSRAVYGYDIRPYYDPNGYDLYNPPGYWNGPIVADAASPSVRAKLDTKAVYALDTLSFGEHWDFAVGLRYDWIDGDVLTDALPGASTNKLSWRTGLVYKPNHIGRFYVAYGTSFNPSVENLAVSGGYAGNKDLEPEKSRTIELGTKWDLLEKRLGVTAALFRVEKTNVRETVSGIPVLAGEQRVQGLELGITGQITPQWEIYGGYAWMDSETTRSLQFPARVGNQLQNTPRHSFNLWTSYSLPVGVKLSYGARYVGKRFNNANNDATIDSYLVHSVMASYQVNDNLRFQLNVDNLTNKKYIEGVRAATGTPARSSAVEYGDGRSIVLSANYQF